MDPTVLLDISRLIGRLLKGRSADGRRPRRSRIHRTLRRPRARSDPRGWPAAAAFKQSVEAHIQRLLNQREVLGATLALDIVLGIAGGLLEPAPRGAVYLNTSHSGLLAPGLGLCLRVKGIQPIWMVHDLIPYHAPRILPAGRG
jgi:hypothetical protein